MTGRSTPRRAWLGEVLGAPIVAVVAAGAAAISIIWQVTRSTVLSSAEAARVELAGRPTGELLDELRTLGLRPLWYLYEHGWIAVFGDGDRSVHLSSAVLAISVLPVAYLAGRAIRGSELGVLAAVAAVASPHLFAAGVDVGPDALLILLVTLGLWVVARAAQSTSVLPPILVALVTGAAMWTHEWAIFPAIGAVAVVGVWIVRASGPERRSAIASLAAIVVGAASVLPWTTDVLGISGATERVRPAAVVTTALSAFHGGPEPVMFVGLVLALVGLFGNAVDERFVVLDFRMRRDARPIALALVVALTAIAAAGLVRRIDLDAEAFAVVLPLFLLLVALGIDRLRGRGRAAGVVVLLIGSTLTVVSLGTQDRTQVDDAVAVIARRPDLPVVVCPPDLATAVRRALPDRAGPVVDHLSDGAASSTPGGPYLLVRDVTPDAPDACRQGAGIADGSALTLLLAPDPDDSEEPVQVELVRPSA